MTALLLRGQVFDGIAFSGKRDILVDGEKGIISGYGPLNSIQPDSGTEIIETDGTILPGLVDVHVHFFGSRGFNFREWSDTDAVTAALRSVAGLEDLLNAGFTTVRDLGSKCAIQLRKAVEEGDITGPDVIPAGKSIAALGGDDDQKVYPLHYAQEISYSSYCHGPWDCVRAVRKEIRNGALNIKVYSGDKVTELTNKPFLREEEIRAIVEEAHGLGARVTAHAYGEEGIRSAVNAGVDSIEHGFGLTDELCRIMAEKGIFLSPTIAAHTANEKYMTGAWKKMTEDHQRKDISLALKHGVRIVLGTDYVGCDTEPHGQNYVELIHLVNSGLTVEQALSAGTYNGSMCLGLNDRGIIAEGMRADIIIAGNDVSKDISLISPQNIEHVIKKGRIIK